MALYATGRSCLVPQSGPLLLAPENHPCNHFHFKIYRNSSGARLAESVNCDGVINNQVID